jgi:hypothetical protein
MHTSLMAIILVSVAIPPSDTAPLISENYRVSEIVRVLSPTSFESKLENYKPAKSVRFRVTLRDSGTRDSKEYLENILKSAGRIELRNAVFKSYFRVEADLWLDGKPVGSEKETVKQLPNPAIYQPVTVLLRQQSQSPEPPTKPFAPVKNHSTTIDKLLDRQIDCSMLTEDTPLSEALVLLSESVEPRLPLLILWKDLQMNALIEKETPIGVEGFGRLKLRQALNIILLSVAGREPKPVLVAEGGILILGTQQMQLNNKTTRVYETTDLLAVPSTADSYNQGGSRNEGANFRR